MWGLFFGLREWVDLRGVKVIFFFMEGVGVHLAIM